MHSLLAFIWNTNGILCHPFASISFDFVFCCNAPILRRLTLIINFTILIQIGQGEHLTNLVLRDIFLYHLHSGLQLVARDVTVAIAIKHPAYMEHIRSKGLFDLYRLHDVAHVAFSTHRKAAIRSCVMSSSSPARIVEALVLGSSRSAWIRATHCRNSFSSIMPFPVCNGAGIIHKCMFGWYKRITASHITAFRVRWILFGLWENRYAFRRMQLCILSVTYPAARPAYVMHNEITMSSYHILRLICAYPCGISQHYTLLSGRVWVRNRVHATQGASEYTIHTILRNIRPCCYQCRCFCPGSQYILYIYTTHMRIICFIISSTHNAITSTANNYPNPTSKSRAQHILPCSCIAAGILFAQNHFAPNYTRQNIERKTFQLCTLWIDGKSF